MYNRVFVKYKPHRKLLKQEVVDVTELWTVSLVQSFILLFLGY
jgi:hypothetical protein